MGTDTSIPSKVRGTQFHSLVAPLLGRRRELKALADSTLAEDSRVKNFLRATEQGEPKVRILTYNIWFEEVKQERLDAVLGIIEEVDADFACF